MPPPWAGVAEVRIVGRIHGQPTNNVFHFATNTVVLDPIVRDQLILELLVQVLACVTEQLVGAVTSDWTLEHVEGRALHPDVGDPIVKAPEAPTQGALSAASHSFAAQLMHLRTSTGGRKGRGRKFLPPPGEGETQGSFSLPLVFNELQEFIACLAGKFVGPAATQPWRLMVFSRTDFKAAGGTYDNSLREVQTMSADTRIAIMGRRKVGVGA